VKNYVCEKCRKPVALSDKFCGNCGSHFLIDVGEIVDLPDGEYGLAIGFDYEHAKAIVKGGKAKLYLPKARLLATYTYEGDMPYLTGSYDEYWEDSLAVKFGFGEDVEPWDLIKNEQFVRKAFPLKPGETLVYGMNDTYEGGYVDAVQFDNYIYVGDLVEVENDSFSDDIFKVWDGLVQGREVYFKLDESTVVESQEVEDAIEAMRHMSTNQ